MKNKVNFTFDDVLAIQCCMETVKKVQEDEALYNKLLNLHNRLYDAVIDIVLEYFQVIMRRLSLKIALSEPKYQCCYCGRTFIEKVAHKCNGNFRKRHLKFIDYE